MKLVFGWVAYILLLIVFVSLLFDESSIPDASDLHFSEGRISRIGCLDDRVRLLSLEGVPITFDLIASWSCEKDRALEPESFNSKIWHVDDGILYPNLLHPEPLYAEVWHTGGDLNYFSDVVMLKVDGDVIYGLDIGYRALERNNNASPFYVGFILTYWSVAWMYKKREHNKAFLEKARSFFR